MSEPGSAGRMARVLIVAHAFPPSREVGAQACAQIARHLPQHGWEPVVLTVCERHISDRDDAAAPKAAEHVVRTGMMPHPSVLYGSFRRPSRAMDVDGRRASANASPAGSSGLRGWLTPLLKAPDVYTGWIPPAVVAGLKAVRTYRISHILSSSPSPTNHLVGLILSRLTCLPWTAQFRDPWVFPTAVWRQTKPLSGASIWLEKSLEGMVVRRAQTVTCVTECHTNWLRRVYSDVASDRFITIPNGFDGAEWEAIDQEVGGSRRPTNDQFVITHAGSLYLRRNPLPLFRALRSLIEAGELAPQTIRVVLIGETKQAGAPDVASMAADCGVGECLTLTGPLSRRDTLKRVVQSDLLLLLAEDLTLQIPGKTYEYLRSGRPILALTSQGAAADLLRRTGGACTVDPADDFRLRAAILDAYRRWRGGGCLELRPDPNIVAGFDRRLLAGDFARLFENSRPCAA